MKTIVGNNNIALIENIDGSFSPEIELDSKTTVITSSDKANIFANQEELRTYIAGLDVAKFSPIPSVGQQCEKGIVYSYGANKVKCLQTHTRMSFTPEETPALWLIIPTVTAGYPAWKQPAGAHDAYQIGDRVSFSGSNYESKINANVWSPTAYPAGWKKL